MAKAKATKQAIKRWCETCSGTGKVAFLGRGDRPKSKSCYACKGTGFTLVGVPLPGGPVPVILETPYASNVIGGVAVNARYARACMLDCLRRGEAPFASHLLYTQVLVDALPDHRELGIAAGLAWKPLAVKTVVYTDRGISPGMQRGIAAAASINQPVEHRTLDGWVP